MLDLTPSNVNEESISIKPPKFFTKIRILGKSFPIGYSWRPPIPESDPPMLRPNRRRYFSRLLAMTLPASASSRTGVI